MYKIVNGTDIMLTRGDTFECDLMIYDNGEPYVPATNDVIKFYMKHASMNLPRTAYTDQEPLIEKTIDNSTLKLHLDPIDTKDLDFGGYVYDIEITFEDGYVDTVINNAGLAILPEVG